MPRAARCAVGGSPRPSSRDRQRAGRRRRCQADRDLAAPRVAQRRWSAPPGRRGRRTSSASGLELGSARLEPARRPRAPRARPRARTATRSALARPRSSSASGRSSRAIRRTSSRLCRDRLLGLGDRSSLGLGAARGRPSCEQDAGQRLADLVVQLRATRRRSRLLRRQRAPPLSRRSPSSRSSISLNAVGQLRDLGVGAAARPARRPGSSGSTGAHRGQPPQRRRAPAQQQEVDRHRDEEAADDDHRLRVGDGEADLDRREQQQQRDDRQHRRVREEDAGEEGQARGASHRRIGGRPTPGSGCTPMGVEAGGADDTAVATGSRGV